MKLIHTHTLSRLVLLPALLGVWTICCAAGEAREMFSISSQGFASFTSLELALDDGAGGFAWTDPADPSGGSFGVYVINDDPLDRSVPGTAGAKLSTYPLGPRYETPGPHIDGPFWIGGYYGLAAGVGPEYLGNWVALRLGSDTANLRGVRFGYSASFDPEELRLEICTIGSGLNETLLETLGPSSFTQREMFFDGASALDLRMHVGPQVPEPSTAAGMLMPAAIAIAGLASRRTRSRTGSERDSAADEP